FDRFEVNGGSVEYIDDSSRIQLHLQGLDLATSLKNPRQGYYESAGRISVDSLQIATGSMRRHLSLEAAYRASYDMASRQLVLTESDITADKLRFAVSGELKHGDTSLIARAAVKSQPISIADLLDLLPEKQLARLAGFSVDGQVSVDGTVEYERGRADPLTYAATATVSDCIVSKKGLTGQLELRQVLISFKPDNVRVNIQEGSFNERPLRGHVVVENFAQPFLNGSLSGRFDLAYLKPFLPTTKPYDMTGEADFDIAFSGPAKDPRNMTFTGSLVVTNGTYTSELLPEPIQSLSLDVYLDDNVARVNKATVETASGRVNLSGRIINVIPFMMVKADERKNVPLSVDLHADGQLELAPLTRYLPQTGKPQLKGPVSFSLEVTGSATDLTSIRPRGTLSITGASFVDSLLPEPIRRLDASMVLGQDTLVIENMTVQFVSSDVSLSGKLIKPLPYLLPLKSIDRTGMKKPLLLFNLNSRRFDTDKMFPEAVPGSGANRASLPLDSLPPLPIPDVDGEGSVHVDTLIYSRIEFTQIDGRARLQDRRLYCYDVKGKVYSGDVTGNTTIDLNDFNHPRYVGEFNATQVEANDFLTRFSKFGGHLFGKVNLKGSYNATGWEPEDFLNSLAMDAEADMYDGKMVTSGTLYTALSGLAGKIGQSLEPEQSLKGLRTNVVVKDGKVGLDQLKTKVGGVGDLEIGGFYGFDGTLHYQGSLLLSPEWTAKLLAQGGLLGGVAGLFADQSVNRIKLPLVVSGTTDKPDLALDYSSLSKGAKDNLSKEAGDLLKGLFKKKEKK
ncbi:MAG TPA: AsmA-like C-terminal region-containing protein, partial [Candidatus Deferrimicrobium sp.]|nr:AsmA-like C-terminal region-containing protein [Candidatus Deferrimicrobium sp.]